MAWASLTVWHFPLHLHLLLKSMCFLNTVDADLNIISSCYSKLFVIYFTVGNNLYRGHAIDKKVLRLKLTYKLYLRSCKLSPFLLTILNKLCDH